MIEVGVDVERKREIRNLLCSLVGTCPTIWSPDYRARVPTGPPRYLLTRWAPRHQPHLYDRILQVGLFLPQSFVSPMNYL